MEGDSSTALQRFSTVAGEMLQVEAARPWARCQLAKDHAAGQPVKSAPHMMEIKH
ncbi:hypothetical protein ACWGTO_05515 [Mesorhizobium sp. PL10]